MSNVKKLYICKNLDELEEKTSIPDVRSKEMRSLLETARKIIEEATKRYNEGDQEAAYILYTRYFNLLNNIHKRDNYPQYKSQIRKILGDNQTNKLTMDRLEDLTKSLDKRYTLLNLSNANDITQTSLTQLRKLDLTSHPNNQIQRSRSVSPIRNGVERNGLLSAITCQQLYDCMQAQSVLVMDCRPSGDYGDSKLNYPLSFNVPAEIIRDGMSAGKLQDKLDQESKKLWSARAIKDQVVLMDWNSSSTELKAHSPISILLDILQRWDPDVVYRSPIRILEGGYEFFVMAYPTCCTNPTVVMPQLSSTLIETSALIEDIEYPSVNDIQLKDDIIAKNQSNSSLTNHKTSSSGRPTVDRSSKSAAMKLYDEKRNAINEIAKEQEVLLEKAKENDEQLEQIAEQLNSVDHKKQLINGGKEMMYQFMQLESEAEDYKNEITRLKAELHHYRRRDEEEKANLPIQLVKDVEQIEAKIEERERVDEQRKKERQQLAEKFAIANKTKCLTRNNNSKAQFEENDLEEDKENLKQSLSTTKLNPPQFDRSIKPKHSSPVDTEVRLRNFSPVSGKVLFAAFTQSMSLYKMIIAGINIQLPTAKRFFPIIRRKGRGLTGLKNLGNTCYMNSIIQCLSNTPPLAEYCVTDKYKNYVSRNNKTRGEIVDEVAALIKMLWTGGYKYVASRDLKYVIGQYQKMFRGYEQQDSHEFLTILMDWLHSDLQTLTLDPLREPMTASDKAWLDFTKAKESLILHLFYGQIKSIVKCAECENESATYECFSNLSLELPENDSTCDLRECLDMYFSGERIHGWNCPRCEHNRDGLHVTTKHAIKKLNIAKLPPVLVIHLKRFYADTDSPSPSYKKKMNYLRFPLQNLDMSPYITVSERKRSTPTLYRLYAVSNHYGFMESGHYTAFCKNDALNHWYKFDDHMVTSLDSSKVISSAAYILFYTRLSPLQAIN
uniref:Ubiquitin carboxyl-terminal hydrolase n=1 Tax=Glossina morsitans morsitans TaxID=37546 RepID=A0A1B0FAZ4_GLOMM